MSGGSLDYVYVNVDDAAERVAAQATCAEHRAFATHLRLVARALHALEWVWSCDTSPGDELPALRAVIAPEATLTEAVRHAEAAMAELRRLVLAAKETTHEAE